MKKIVFALLLSVLVCVPAMALQVTKNGKGSEMVIGKL